MADRAATEAARATFLNCILDVSLASEIVFMCLVCFTLSTIKENEAGNKINPQQVRLTLFLEYLYTDCLEIETFENFSPSVSLSLFLILFLFVDV